MGPDLEKLRELAQYHMPLPVVTAQIAHETYCYRAEGPVTLFDGTCPVCGWRHNPHPHIPVSVHPEDLLWLIEEIWRLRTEVGKLGGVR